VAISRQNAFSPALLESERLTVKK